MVWIYATRNVAPVTNNHAVRDRASRKLEREPMGPYILACNFDAAVPALRNLAKPKPATGFSNWHGSFFKFLGERRIKHRAAPMLRGWPECRGLAVVRAVRCAMKWSPGHVGG